MTGTDAPGLGLNLSDNQVRATRLMDTLSTSTGSPARVVLVGVRGYGAVHAERIARLADQGAVRLVAAVDPGVVMDPPTIYGVDLYAELAQALDAVGPVDVVVIAAPIGDHFRLAQIALTSGADVYLEKPPVASMDDFDSLLATERETGHVVQVGFQSLGSRGLEMLETDALGVGRVVRVSAVGAWSRTVGYWNRSPWAGRRSLHGRVVNDGVVTNPLAHAVATALAVVGCRRREDVESVETDLYRANAIDSDDTSVVRIHTTRGLPVTCALSMCSPIQREPQVQIQGTLGRATFAYTADRLDVETEDRSRTEITGRVDLLENLLAHRQMECRCSCRWSVPERSCACWTPSRPRSPCVSILAQSDGKARATTGVRSSTMSSTGCGRPP